MGKEVGEEFTVGPGAGLMSLGLVPKRLGYCKVLTGLTVYLQQVPK